MPGTTNGREWTMADIAQDTGYLRNRKLKKALLQHSPLTSQGLSERLFGLLFSGLVNPLIWEAPDVDVQAIALCAHHRIVTNGRGGGTGLVYTSNGRWSCEERSLLVSSF